MKLISPFSSCSTCNVQVRQILLIQLLLLLQSTLLIKTQAMYPDEIGQHDFTITSAGHGIFGVTYAQLSLDNMSVLTSSFLEEDTNSYGAKSNDNNSDKGGKNTGGVGGDGCYLSSRSILDGSLQWRRNVCSNSRSNNNSNNSINNRFTVHVPKHNNNNSIYTLDDTGIIRKWNQSTGDMVHELKIDFNDDQFLTMSKPLSSSSSSSLLSLLPISDTVLGILYHSREYIIICNMIDMKITQVLPASSILTQAKVTSHGSGKKGRRPVIVNTYDGNIIAAYAKEEEQKQQNNNQSFKFYSTTVEEMGMINFMTNEGKAFYKHTSSKSDDTKQFANTFYHSISPFVIQSSTNSKNAKHNVDATSKMTSMIGIMIDNNTSSSSQLLVYAPSHDEVQNKETLNAMANNLEGMIYGGIGYLQCKDTSITIDNGKITSNVLQKSVDITTSFLINNNNNAEIKFLKMLKCYDDGSITALVTTTSGSTVVFECNSDSIEKKWVNEEAFGSVTSTIFLDWHQEAVEKKNDVDNEEENALLDSLTFTSRLKEQYKSLIAFLSGGFFDNALKIFNKGSNTTYRKDDKKELMFGLRKVALMLSNPLSKLLAIDTSSKGEIIWSMNLNSKALWHKVVHGASTSRSSVLGHGMHHPHSPEVLVLSKLDNSLEWRCMDGLRGRIISEATIALNKDVVQIIPIHSISHAGGGCKQNALILLEDHTHVVIPNMAQSTNEISKIIDFGLYSHKINRENGRFTTMKIPKEANDEALVIGETVFDPKMEKIINVVYPQRNEVVQSPSTILGDDSLLLKYLNPHICVVVTEATEELISELENEEENTFYSALKSGSGSDKRQKKKPVGVTKPGEEAPPKVVKPPSPTLFINVMDTVSGQILYRVSHAHVSPESNASTKDTNVPVVISENWIVYAFPNAKSRRTEVGVITLHEGMIDKQGISAFSTPEQQEIFSSLTSPKPVALTKTYVLAVPVSALGVTNTKNGISSKNILISTGVGGQIIRIDRRLLDPRRPSGEPKDSEKKEGLMQYSPFLPTPPMMVQSYTNYIEDATSIQSVATNLESQTLIIAYGGPDIFFTRFAPSKGFDSLPETFNKFAIISVLVVLGVGVNKLKRMSEKKFVKLGWS